jgi:transcription elongation factor Elf1
MKISTLDELQIQISKTACPNCKKKELDLQLRCDLGQQECLYLVKCGNCNTNYTIATDTKALAEHLPDVEDILSILTCPECGSAKTELGFQCDLTTKGCFYTITCKSCKRVIREYK